LLTQAAHKLTLPLVRPIVRRQLANRAPRKRDHHEPQRIVIAPRHLFDQEIFAQLTAAGARVTEIAIPTRYFLEASSVSFKTSVKYGLMTLKVLYRFRRDERKRDWALLRPPAAKLRRDRSGEPTAKS
jgi:hypothetical protein